MNTSESREDLLQNEARAPSVQSLKPPTEYVLGPVEKHFLVSAERGDCATVRRLLEEHKGHPEILNINCVDPLNRSALISAIENENIELIKILLDWGIQVKDSLLHAIKEEYVEAVEMLLNWEEKNHTPGQPYSWEALDAAEYNFTPDITPLILAAHKNNYEILKILLDRGATLPCPHDARCGCDECVTSSEQDSLRHSRSRINAYRALTSPSLIALSSRDPLLTAFELSWELRRLSRMEQEFRSDYNELKEQCQEFATTLLDHARSSQELEIILNYNPTGDNWEPGERQTLDRLKLAIKYKQKAFVAHPNVQQLLAAIWYDGLPGFRRLSMVGQLIKVAKLGSMFPIYSSIYMVSPTSQMGLFMKKPFVKFICHSSSYAFFLMLLGMASQRIEYLVIELFGNAWMREILEGWKKRERGCIPGFVESGVIIYVISLISAEIRSLWSDGLLEYISDLWNIVDFIQNTFYVIWIFLRATAWFVVQREYWSGDDPWYPRDQWHAFDPMLLSEGAFAAGMIFSFLKLVHIFSVNPHLGPLQISLGRMIIDIIKFFFIYTLVLFAFGCGMNQLLWYYADLEKAKCYHADYEIPDFDNQEKACSIWRRFANLFETSQSLFWASFGMIDLMSFDLTGIKSFTRFWALLMFGSYSVINVIVLLNMLIAMMSNSYQIISERSDTEWKFARSHLWMSYFEDGDTVPAPFNMIPTAKTFNKIIKCGNTGRPTKSLIKKSREKAQERHDTVIRILVRRYVTSEQRKRDEYGITEDDVMEIRQDISTLRYELIDILRQNGMKTPNVDQTDTTLSGKKGRVMERLLQKDFQIGIVEGIVNAVIQNEKEPKDVFSQLARAIGKRASATKKKDWNAAVRQSTITRDPIGSRSEAEIKQTRRSLRIHQKNHPDSDLASFDPDRLVSYNPNLSEVSPATRVAYAKFIMGKLDKAKAVGEATDDKKEQKPAEEGTKSQRASLKVMVSGISQSRSSPPSSLSGSLKKSVLKPLSSVSSQDKSDGEFRTIPSPIPEDPEGESVSTSTKTSSQTKDEQRKESADKTESEDKKESTKVEKKPTEDEKKDEQTKKEEEEKKSEEEEKKDESKKEEDKKTDDKKPAKTEAKPAPKPSTSAEPSSTQQRDTYGQTKARGKSKVTGKITGGWL
ncbi:transient receptor potential protein [Chelonus insularis]|uniref:transient receptor potential protein n=1 Tax=Chelonus insularis TaxID=460826 RepID=UPI00158B8576|nr:transient receptor potential protein [Chelonus insularis]